MLLNSELFQFTFIPSAILSFIGALAMFFLLYILNSKPHAPKSARWLSYMVIQAAIWGIFEGLNRASNNIHAAIFWEQFSWMGWFFMGPTIIGFSDSYRGRNKVYSTFLKQLLFFAPGLILVFLAWNTNLVFDRDPSHWERLSYGQWVTHTGPVFDIFVLPYVSLLTAYGIFRIFLYAKSKEIKMKLQSLAIVLGITIPVIGASITNGIFMIFYFNDVIRLGSVWLSVGFSVMTYAIFKYNLFSVNPATFVDNIVETVNEILLVLNTDHVVEYTNNAIESILGYPKNELIGQRIDRIFGAEWPTFLDKILTPIEKGTSPSIHSFETELVAANGTKVPVSFSVSPYKDPTGKIVSTIQVISDIRQLKELLNITAERNKLKAMMESISDGILALDTEGKIILANSAASTMLNLSAQQILGKSLNNIISISDENQRRIETHDLLPTTSTNLETMIVRKSEVQITTAAGKETSVNLISSIIKEGNQVGLGAILTLIDLSKEKALDDMKLDFVSMAAHELRTPLTVIIGYLSIYIKRYSKDFTPEQKQYIDRVNQASQNLVVLIENLLNVTRVERGLLVLNLGLLSWVEFVRQTTTGLKEVAKNKKIDLGFIEPTQNMPLMYVDKVKIGEVLGNLIDNAIKYTAEQGYVKVWLEVNGKYMITHIEDNGRGIPQESQAYLFTKFFRASKNLVQTSSGTGLGLYISKSIVDKHRGRIWVQSVPNKGSVFSFALPIYNNIVNPNQQTN